MAYDRRGNKTATEYLGLDGTPALGIESVRSSHSYNAQNQLVESTYFGLNRDKPIGIERFTYNDLGQKVEEAYFDMIISPSAPGR